jgi:flagellar basal-body rod protein FlgB
MFDKLEILSLSGGLARHSAARQSLVARNIANADTPGYRPLDITAFQPERANERSGFAMMLKQTRAGHLATPQAAGMEPREHSGSAKPNGNGVSLETEMVKAADIRNRHQMAVTVYGTAMDVLRSSLGRR